MESEEPKPVPLQLKRNKVLQFISEHPLAILIGFLGAIASIIGLPIAVWFGIWPTLPKRELTYAIQPVRTAIVQVKQASDIAVSYKGKPIQGDLTAAQIMIANAGKEPIESNDILSPLSLVISNASIIELSLSVRPKDGTDFFTVPTSKDRIPLSWKILERGDNPVIQVVYAGKRDAPITLEGRIKGQQSIKQVAWPAASAAAMWRLFVTFMVGGVIGLAAGLIVLPAKSTRRNLIIGVLSLLTVLVVYYFLAAFFPSFLK